MTPLSLPRFVPARTGNALALHRHRKRQAEQLAAPA